MLHLLKTIHGRDSLCDTRKECQKGLIAVGRLRLRPSARRLVQPTADKEIHAGADLAAFVAQFDAA